MNSFKVGDKVVKVIGSGVVYEVDFHRKSRKLLIRRYSKDRMAFDFFRPYCSLRLATPKEIEQGFRDEIQ